MFDLEREVSSWRGALAAKGKLSEESIDELEGHLRDEMAELASKGLESDEAFLISAKRLGNLDSVAREFALAAISTRIGAFGASPNKVAALGENILLFVDLAGLAICYAAFLSRRRGIESAVKWQTAFFLPILVWSAVVALVFPPIFGFA